MQKIFSTYIGINRFGEKYKLSNHMEVTHMIIKVVHVFNKKYVALTLLYVHCAKIIKGKKQIEYNGEKNITSRFHLKSIYNFMHFVANYGVIDNFFVY